jgi:hypothetical protein
MANWINDSWHPFPTNYSNGTSVDGVGKMFFKYPDFILGGYAGIGWTLLIFVMAFGLSMAAGVRKALGVAGFISFIFSLYFLRLGILNITVSIALIIITIIGVLGGKEEGGI